MNFKRSALSAILLTGTVCFGLAQNNPRAYYKPDLIAASPTAANLGKYGDVPVTMYTGQANIAIPIFNVTSQELSLPISLTYNYMGLKPYEQIGWVGLGWSLQAGGVITRTIRGKQDVLNSTSPYEWANVPGLNNIGAFNQDTLRAAAENGTFDLEPDVFNFNFGKYSGKFIGYRGKFYVMPAQKLKVAGSSTGFIITTEDGVRYEFFEYETTTPKNSNGGLSTGTYNSALYLTKITNAAGTETINLEYSSDGVVTQVGPAIQHYLKPSTYQKQEVLYPITTSMPTFVSTKRLTAIKTSKYQVYFNPEPFPRKDVRFGTQYALRTISVTSAAGNPIKSFDFNYDYTNGTDTLTRYLRLGRLKEYVNIIEGGSDSLIHTFEYHGNNYAIRQTAGGVDHWGFSNGSASFTLLPNTIYPGGANREPSFDSALQGSLKKITYPTGGTTEFEYEQNRLGTGTYAKESKNAWCRLVRQNWSTTNALNGTGAFSLNVAQQIYTNVMRVPKNPWPGENAKDNIDAELTIYNSSSAVFTRKIFINEQNGGRGDSLLLPAGNYTYSVRCDASENHVEASIGYYHQSTVPQTTAGPGVRVKKIISTPKTGFSIHKTYTYSSGSAAPPVYSQNTHIEKEFPADSWVPNYFTYTTYTSTLSEGSAFGLPIFYPQVTEDTGSDTSKILRSVHSFDMFETAGNFLGAELLRKEDYKKSANGFVLHHKTEYNYDLKTDTIFNSIKPYIDSITIKVGSVASGGNKHYAYEIAQLVPIWKQLVSTTETFYNNDTLTTTTFNTYHPTTRNLIHVRQRSSDGSVTIQKMKYPEDYAPAISAPFKAAHVLSPVLEQQVWRKSSATDSVLISGSVTEYDNVLFQPQKIYSLDATSGISSLNAQTVDGNGNFTSLISDARYKEKVTYSYGTDGRIITQKLTDGVPSSYRWGYLATDPAFSEKPTEVIAECKNCLPSEFFVENFEDNTSATYNTAHTGERYYNGSSYTVNWTKPNNRNYVISFWYKTAAGWKYSGEKAYSGTSYNLTGGSGYDDIRIYPTDAQVSTNTFKQGIGVSSAIDAKGVTSYYDYDLLGRLHNIKDQYGNILKNYKYNYAVSQTPVYYSKEFSGWVFRANSTCNEGEVGLPVKVSVPGGVATSTVSQQDADNLANAQVSGSAQADANSAGGCALPVVISFVNNTVNGSGQLGSLNVKSSSGYTYSFTGAQLTTGVTIPRGIYTMEFVTGNECYDINYNLGWMTIMLPQGVMINNNCDGAFSHVVNNLNLTATSSYVITMSGLTEL